METPVTEAIGFSALHTRPLRTDAAARDAALTLLVSPAWGAQLRYFLSSATPGLRLWRKPGMIPAKTLREVVDAALQSEEVGALLMSAARNSTPDSRGLDFSRYASGYDPFSRTYGYRPLAGDDVASWLEAVLTFVDCVGASTGVVVAMATCDHVLSECSGCTFSHNGQVMHPYPKQLARMLGLNSVHMGTRYMRFPRWGTLISHDHVAQLGGVGAITAAVGPALVRELSGGVYFQLTDSLATARSEDAVIKRKAFTDFAAPLLPPPQAPR